MGRLLLTVAETFQIEGRGLILVPGIIPQKDQPIQIGDAIELRRPDGTSLDAHISGLEGFTPTRSNPAIPILLPREIAKADVPIGTQVWSVD